MKKAQPRRGIALGQTAMTMVTAVVPKPLTERFAITVNGLVVTGHPSLEEAGLLGDTLRTAEKGIQFAIGDFANYIEETYGEESSQILDFADGWSESTVNNYRWIAKQVTVERRRMDRLTIKHHQLVAPLSPRLQEKWLTKAANDDGDEPWTVKRLADAMEAGKDLPPDAWWVQVLCKSEDDQAQMQKALQAQGRTVKLLASRNKKKE